MRIAVQKWGNSAAVRLPAHVVKQLGLAFGDCLELSADNGRIVLSPARREYKLKEVIAGISKKNRHGVADFGAPVGREAW